MNNYFAGNLKFLRKSRKLNQTQLAEIIGKKKSIIGTYEAGKSFPNVPVLQLLGKYFDLPVDDLIKKDLTKAATPTVKIGGANYLELMEEKSTASVVEDRLDSQYVAEYLKEKEVDLAIQDREDLIALGNKYRQIIDKLIVENMEQKKKIFKLYEDRDFLARTLRSKFGFDEA